MIVHLYNILYIRIMHGQSVLKKDRGPEYQYRLFFMETGSRLWLQTKFSFVSLVIRSFKGYIKCQSKNLKSALPSLLPPLSPSPSQSSDDHTMVYRSSIINRSGRIKIEPHPSTLQAFPYTTTSTNTLPPHPLRPDPVL